MAGYNIQLETEERDYHENIIRVILSGEIAVIRQSLVSFGGTITYRSQDYYMSNFTEQSFKTEFERWNILITRKVRIEKIEENEPTDPEKEFWEFMVKNYDPIKV